MGRCKTASSIFNVVVSLGMFSAIMCFHLISFVIFISLSTLIVIGLALIFTYFSGHSLPIFVENLIILILLSFMSKYHLIFYYKLIYPGDNYERHCWSFNKKFAKLIYGILASYAFVQVITLYYYRRDISHEHDQHHDHGSHNFGIENGIKSILSALWADENKYFLASMAILVHLFSVCLYQDFSILLQSVSLCSCRCFVAISYAVAVQSLYFFLYFCEFYVIHAWIPLSIIKDNLMVYAVLTQLFVMLWVLQATFLELVTEKMCNLIEKNDKPYYWFQNTGRARILFLKYVLLPLVVYLFYADHDYSMFNIGGIVPSENPNRSLFFTSFFSSFILSSLKSLMLLKNGLARLAFAVCLCYFIIYDTLNCCESYDDDDDDDDDLTEISSGAFSELTEDGLGKSDSSTSHFDRSNNSRYNSHSRRLQDKRRQRIEHLNSREVGDHKRNKKGSQEDLKLPRRIYRRGTGDEHANDNDVDVKNNNSSSSVMPNNSTSVPNNTSSSSHVNVNMNMNVKGLYDNNNFRVSSTVI